MLDAYSQSLNDVIVSIYDSVVRVETQMLDKSGQDLSISEMHIIEAVWKSADGACSISDIAQARQVTLPSMTVAIKRLEKKGFVEKIRSAKDARVVMVTLTRKGERVNSMHRYFHERMVRSFLKNIDTEERSTLLKTLKNMDDFLLEQIEKYKDDFTKEGIRQ